jgi:hypothetical protein
VRLDNRFNKAKSEPQTTVSPALVTPVQSIPYPRLLGEWDADSSVFDRNVNRIIGR